MTGIVRALVVLGVVFILVNPGAARAQYQSNFPNSATDTWNTYYGPPYLTDEGDTVVGVRQTPGIPSVNNIAIDVSLDTTWLYCYGYLLFYLDGIYVAYAEMDPLYYTQRFTGNITIPADQVAARTSHTVEVELYNDIWACAPYPYIGYVDFYTGSSFVSLNLVGADNDSDGHYSTTYHGDDCNDGDPTIYPGRPEACDGKDNNCNGSIDEGVGTRWYRDADGDTWGSSSVSVVACSAPSGYVSRPGDCNDSNGAVNPGATEICDSLDNDCDNSTDENVKSTFYDDDDGDGYGDANDTTQACTRPTGYAANSTDCNDQNAAVHPGAAEVCNGIDDNCNASTDEGVTTLYFQDTDGDGYGSGTTTRACTVPAGYAEVGGDCGPSDASIHPGAPELCDGKDNDCDGVVDDGATTTYYPDGDGDGWGVGTGATQACSRPTGYAAQAGDCDDTNGAVHPTANEACNGIDDNCNGSADEGVTTVYFEDNDGDHYGSATTTRACSRPAGYADVGSDCNDANATVYPNAAELCEGLDNDCDTKVDEGVKTTFYGDADDDGYGVASSTTQACAAPDGYAGQAGDCNDGDAATYPGASELCDTKDNDCDSRTDEGVTSVVYADDDHDGWGDGSDTLNACQPPTGYVGRAGDCNDADAQISPDATERCDSVDQDCDTRVDEGVKTTFYADADGDTWGDGASTTQACAAPSGYVSRPGDCNDLAGGTFPGATETCDAVDQDCDSTIDEGVKTTYFLDADGDSFGVATTTTQACQRPSGYAAVAGDCGPDDAAIYPGASERCDGLDGDCDGGVDEGVQDTFYQDVDGDGYGTLAITTQGCQAPDGYADAAGDCDDSQSGVNPDADEACDAVDNDCDLTVDEGVKGTFYQDVDEDGHGAGAVASSCEAPDGYVAAGDDCDDRDPASYPGAPERCDDVDQDCDGVVTDAVAPAPWYPDLDGDGYGDAAQGATTCPPAAGSIPQGGDCNDRDAEINPGEAEICDGVDTDCDGAVDDGVKTTYYRDADGDGHGNPADTRAACAAPSGYVATGLDCNDGDATIYPSAPEACDSKDQDCDSRIDEGVLITFYADQDLDTFGDPATTTSACSRPNGYVGAAGDCDDDEAEVNPNADEVCDGVDQDCDEAVDEGVLLTFYADADQDGFGDDDVTSEGCEPGEGEVRAGGDCDDGDAQSYPGAPEICGDGVDQDCNGYLLSCDDADVDGDGYAPSQGDCDDGDASVHPGAEELCDGVDQDCDGHVDDRDQDGDGYVDVACALAGASAKDCDDGDASVHPGAAEVCDGVDNDCSGAVDDKDDDGDGYVDAACLDEGGDCDDDDGRLNPGAEEICDGLDNDCSGVVDDRDADGDTYVARACGGDDCDDADPDIGPGAEEVEDGVDNDCDGKVDEGSDAFDDDGDGFTENGGDCDDADPNVGPGQVEDPTNGIDDNCDGQVDEEPVTPPPTETPQLGTPTFPDTPTPAEITAPVATPTLESTACVGAGCTPTPTEGETAAPSIPPATDAPTLAEGTPTVGPTATPTEAVDNQPTDGETTYGVATPTNTGTDEGCACTSQPGSGAGALGWLLFGAAVFLRRRTKSLALRRPPLGDWKDNQETRGWKHGEERGTIR